MKKILQSNRLNVILTGALAFSCFLLLLIRSDTAIEYMKKGLKLCAENVIPSLFPFMVISDILVKSGVGQRLGRVIGRPFRWLFGVSENVACAFILGLLCGFPVGAAALCGMYDQKQIGKGELAAAMTFCNNPGSAFVISAVGVSLLGNRKAGMLLYLSVVLSAIAVGFFGRFLRKNKKSLSGDRAICVLERKRSFLEIFTSAILNSASAMLTVCAYVTFFSSFVGCLGVIFERIGISGAISAAIFGIFEISGGVRAVSMLESPRLALLLCSAILGWSGISVHLQIASVCRGRVDLRPYFAAKIAQSILCCLFSYGLVGIFDVL